MKPYNLLLLLLLFPYISFSQDFENYQTLLSKGKMPDDFKLMASEKYKNDLEDIKKENASKKDKKRKRNFALESNFAITDMMMSGRVIYITARDITKFRNMVLVGIGVGVLL